VGRQREKLTPFTRVIWVAAVKKIAFWVNEYVAFGVGSVKV